MSQAIPTTEKKSFWQKQAELWMSMGKSGVARKEIHIFTCGKYKSKSVANLDSLGIGPGAIRLGRDVIYPLETLVPWLEARTKPIERRMKRVGGVQ